MLVTLRRLYVYAALTAALLATGFACAFLIQVGLRALGLREAAELTPALVRESVAGGVAILAFALPVGALHLWFARRALRDPEEATSWPRHLALNAWIAFGLWIALGAVFGITNFLVRFQDRDMAALQTGTLVFALGATVAAWRWRERTPGAPRLWQLLAAFVTLAMATMMGAESVAQVAAALRAAAVSEVDAPLPLGASLVPVAAAVAVWLVGLRWQWASRDVWFRPTYAAAVLAIGLGVFGWAAVEQLAALVALARGAVVGGPVLTASWEGLLVGAVLAPAHLGWLLADRGRPRAPVITDRILAVVVAGCGAVALFAAWVLAWTWASDRLRAVEEAGRAPLTGDLAVAAVVVGAVLYLPALVALLRATAGVPDSALRRGYLFGTIGLALVVTLACGSFAAYNAVSLALGGTDPSFTRDAVRFAGYAAGAVVALAAHLAWLRGDLAQGRPVPRASRTARPAPPAPAAG